MADNNNYGRRSTDRNNNNNNGGNINGKYSMSYYGKNYELIDIKNLQKANAILVESIAKQREFIKEQQKRIDNGEKLNRQQEIYLQSAREAVKVEQERADKNYKVIDAWNRNIRSTLKNNPNKNDVLSGIIQTANSRNTQSNYQNMPKNIADIFNTVISNRLNANQLKETEKVYDKVSDSVVRKYKRQGADFSDAKTIDRMNQEIQEQTVAKMGDITTKYGKATTVLSVATEVFKEAVNTWVSVFKTGLGNQKKTFENTFEPISVRNNTTRGMYYAAQSELGGFGKNRLAEMGLNDNIATSDVQKMWEKMAENGIKIDMSTEESRAEVSAKAIDLVLTNKIVPFLDTSSSSIQHLNERLGDSFIKQIRGINQANLSLVGSNYMTEDILNELLEMVAPMSDEALQNLTQGSVELTALANKLTASKEQGGYGLTKAQAQEYIKMIYKSQRNPDQLLQSGNLLEQLFMVDLLERNINPNDVTKLDDTAASAITQGQYITSWGPSLYGSATDNLISAVIGTAGGLSYDMRTANEKLNSAGVTRNDLLFGTTQDEINYWANLKTEQYKGGGNQTNQTLQDITVENLANELAVGEEWMGHWTDVIVKAIQAVGAILLTKVVGGAIGKMAGSLLGSGGGGGLMGLLGGGAGAAVSGVALGVLSATAIMGIASAISDANLGKANSQANKELYDTESPLYGNKVATEVLGASYTNQGAIDWENGNGFVNGLKTFGGALGEGGRWIGSWVTDASGDNSGYYKNFRDALNMSDNSMDEEYRKSMVLAWLLLADYGNGSSRLGDINLSHSDLVSYLQSDDSPSVYEAMKHFGEAPLYGWRPKDSGDNRVDNISSTYLKNLQEEVGENFHRQGLDYVPYDNYKAVLHEGEAVLTASTASELRNLIDEYRNTAKQSVQFDVIIQNQTNALVNKMGEIIAVMQNNRPMFPTTATNKGNEILNYSMTKMVSTRDFSQ